MTVIIPEGFAQITYRWSSPNFVSGGATSTFGSQLFNDDLSQTAQRWASAWDESLGQIADSDISLVEVTAVTATESASVPGPGPNGNTVDSESPSVAVLLRLQSSRRGPRGRGRLFLPGLAASSLVNESGLLTPSYRDELQTLADEWGTGGVIAERPLVILQGSEGISPPISPPPNVGLPLVDQRVATQRRRLRR